VLCPRRHNKPEHQQPLGIERFIAGAELRAAGRESHDHYMYSASHYIFGGGTLVFLPVTRGRWFGIGYHHPASATTSLAEHCRLFSSITAGFPIRKWRTLSAMALSHACPQCMNIDEGVEIHHVADLPPGPGLARVQRSRTAIESETEFEPLRRTLMSFRFQ
jgi:hypothetical protein